ncbi:class I SAM-dependent methyltransferase [Halobacterium wangiae]|uniref:class I SAM-dependent methyltransferase n=1 Tax=Halobacterium wangiae TaxID=2902623 RepID=UPI001E2AE2E6|nr:class I SAM-dependent methyltransferase [Halobacterium wangiae]
MDYRELLLLRAARETGVLDALVSTADTPAEVAETAGVTERAAELTVDALLEMGLLEQVGDAVEPTNRMLGFITKTDVRSVGTLPHELDRVEALVALPETMRTGDPPVPRGNALRNRLGARAAEDDASVRAAVTAAVREQPDAESVLVVDDGPGRHAVEFARRGFDVTMLAEQRVVDAVRPLLGTERVDLLAGDPLAGADGSFDVVFHARVAHGYGPEENRQLLAAAREALVDGGLAVHVDVLRDGTPDAGLTAELLAGTGAGECHAAETVGEWFTDAGFEAVREGDVPGTEYGFVAGRRRAVE